MQAGVDWVNSERFDKEPSDLDMFTRLSRSAQLQTQLQAFPVAHKIWRRELRVMSLNPVEHMRVEIHIDRDPRFRLPIVGVGLPYVWHRAARVEAKRCHAL
jgi:hypothetical protein